MRLWSLHPRYLDPQGLVALWRETLLARKVLRGETRGYRHHPQLQRFRESTDPLAAIDAYLAAVHAEATARGYAFDAAKFAADARSAPIAVTRGQVEHEWEHLMRKLQARNPELHARWRDLRRPRAHPSFRIVAGPVAEWERAG
jgi:hypothetical protein